MFEDNKNIRTIDNFDSQLEQRNRKLIITTKETNDWYQKAIDYFKKGNLNKSAFCYKQAINLSPNFKEAYNNLSIVLLLSGRYQEALKYLKIVINKSPSYVDPYINMGIIFELDQRCKQAEKCYEKALQIDPFSLEANLNLGKIYELDYKLDSSLTCYLNALQIEQNNSKLHLNLGIIYHKQMQLEMSFNHFKIASNNSLIGKIHYNLALPIIYRTENEIVYYRKRFSKGLHQIIFKADLSTSKALHQYTNAIKNFTPFYLQYQGKDDIDLQKKYGKFVYQIMSAKYPQWVKKRKMVPLAPKERLRVGYVSSYMQSHSVGKFIIGWYRYHNRDRIKIYSYYINRKTDTLTDEYRQNSDVFHHLPDNIEMVAHQIEKDKLHFLIFTDIGMFPPATMLAGLRMAPIQCVTWGHPITTGLPTIDYFLSSNLMEPFNGQNYYSECLVRLPNLALAQQQEMLLKKPKSRSYFNLPQSAFIYLSSQSLYKYLPQFDFIFPKIAQQVPDSLFVFIAHASTYVTKAFEERISVAFSHHGLSFSDHCRIVPRMGKLDFLSLNACCNVLLDNFEWSGCNSSIEGISCSQMPVVTCPGKFMRGRHTFAMLKMMGITETIAKDPEDYVSIASRLGQDQHFYKLMKNRMETNYHILFNDSNCVAALENFFWKKYRNSIL